MLRRAAVRRLLILESLCTMLYLHMYQNFNISFQWKLKAGCDNQLSVVLLMIASEPQQFLRLQTFILGLSCKVFIISNYEMAPLKRGF